MPLLSRLTLGIDDQKIVVGLLRLADAGAVAITGIVTFWARHGTAGESPHDQHVEGVAHGVLQGLRPDIRKGVAEHGQNIFQTPRFGQQPP